MDYRMEDGWRKVSATYSLTFASALLFNIVTGESVTVWTRDYDRWDATECGGADWHDVPIDNDAWLAYCRKNGIVAVGLRAKVVKGRKVPIGYSGLVSRIRKIYDRYDRWVANYVEFEDGTRTNINNCVLDD